MRRIGAIALGDAISLRRSGLRVAASLAVLAFGWLVVSPFNFPTEALVSQTDWWTAGQAFQTAATIGALLACIFGAHAIQDDRDTHVIEAIAVTPVSGWEYLLGKLVAVLVLLLLPGVLLALFLPIQRAMLLGTVDPIPYLAGLAIIYLPTILLSLAFGLTVATVFNSTRVAVVCFCAWWFACVMRFPLPSALELFSVTGFLQNGAFFESAGSRLESAPAEIRMTVLASLPSLREHAAWAVVMTCGAALLLLVSLGFWLSRRWRGDAIALLE